jgi:hypothetical protein
MQLMNGYPILLIGTNQGLVYIIKYEIKDQISYDIVSIINLGGIENDGVEEQSEVSAEQGNVTYKKHTSIFDLTQNSNHPNELLS